MSLRCTPPNFFFIHGLSVPLKKGVLWHTSKCGTQEFPDTHNLHLLLPLSIASQVLVLSPFALTFGIDDCGQLWPSPAGPQHSRPAGPGMPRYLPRLDHVEVMTPTRTHIGPY